MATRSRRGEVIDAQAARVLETAEPPEFEAAPLDADMERFLVERADGIADAKIQVYKCASQSAQTGALPPAKGQPRDAWLFETSPAEFSEEYVQLNYGPGSYRVRMYGTVEGKYGLMFNRIIEIGPLPLSKQNAQLPVPAPGAGGINVNVPGGGAAEIAKAIAEANAPIIAALTVMLQKMADGGGRKVIIEEMTMLASLFKPAPAEGQQNRLMEAISLAEKLSELRGDGEGKGDVYGVLKEAVRQIGGPLGQLIQQQVSKQSTPALPDGAPAGSGMVSITEGEAVMLAMRGQLGIILEAAQSDSDPELYGNLIYDRAPEMLLAELQGEKWFESLCGLEPEFAKHKEWCEKVRAVVLRIVKEEADAAAAEVTPITAAAGAKGSSGGASN